MTIFTELTGSIDALLLWLDAHTRQIALASMAGAVLVAVLIAARWGGQRLLTREVEWVRIIGRALAAMRGWFMLALAAKLVTAFAYAPAEIAVIASFAFVVAASLQAALIARALILGTLELRAATAEPAGSLDSALGLIRVLVTIGLFGIAGILILSNVGVDATGLIAGLGIGGIAIGLAAQGIFSDLFAALAILFDQPFRRGDFIRWEGTSGTVEAIGLKTTRIRTVSGEQAIIANTVLLAKETRNFARAEYARATLMLRLSPRTPPPLIADVPTILRGAVAAVENARFVRGGLSAFGPTSLDIEFVFDVFAADAAAALGIRHAVNSAVVASPIGAHLCTL